MISSFPQLLVPTFRATIFRLPFLSLRLSQFFAPKLLLSGHSMRRQCPKGTEGSGLQVQASRAPASAVKFFRAPGFVANYD